MYSGSTATSSHDGRGNNNGAEDDGLTSHKEKYREYGHSGKTRECQNLTLYAAQSLASASMESTTGSEG